MALVPRTAGADDVHVHIVNFDYDPSPLTVLPGTTVEWDNHDQAPHTATSTTGAFGSPFLDQDDTWAFTFATPGTYPYFCQVHGPSMSGTVHVVDPDAPDLVVESLTVTDVDTWAKQITAVVSNIGSGPAGSSSTRIGYYNRGRFRFLSTLPTDALGAGQSTTLTLSWDVSFKIGDFTVEARADFLNEVQENKGNNTQTATTSVLVSGVPGVDPFDP